MRQLRATVAAGAAVLLLGGAALAEISPAEVCLDTAPGVIAADEWEAAAAAVAEALAERPSLFPSPSMTLEPERLDISSGHAALARGHAPCLESGYEWTARFGRAFLEAGAELMLAEAPTTPGIDSEVTIEWHPDETRLRTVLVFAGPLDIPNGTCWIDDTLAVEDGVVLAGAEQGVRTSPFAEAACGRFFDHLPDGGAGEQAVTLLPAAIELGDGTTLRFVADDVFVREDAVVVAGSLARE